MEKMREQEIEDLLQMNSEDFLLYMKHLNLLTQRKYVSINVPKNDESTNYSDFSDSSLSSSSDIEIDDNDSSKSASEDELST